MTETILSAVMSFGVLGLLLGAGLALAGRIFAVETDPREERALAALPGVNCGACGFPGCGGYAHAVACAGMELNRCPVGGAAVAAKLADIMGKEAAAFERRFARVFCNGGRAECPERFSYKGIISCQAANLVGGGGKLCTYGCLGMGSCADACPFDAIAMSVRGLPVVDEAKCAACGRCVLACPRGLMRLVEESKRVIVACSSRDRGPDTMKICKVGCIACRLCEKNCPVKAIAVSDNLARHDFAKCEQHQVCVQKCPKKTIVVLPPLPRRALSSS
ncbi:MAG: RnfABCDGE type electron transport complex subunit B [Elusimicrobiota bacterium]|jgi:Na+-translocating ferredoxin:NAD+ oxidoreductase RNF subunit RnfB